MATNLSEYEGLDAAVASELVLRARHTHAAPRTEVIPEASYGLPADYGMKPAPNQPPVQPSANNISNIIASLGYRPELKDLLAQVQSPQPVDNNKQPNQYPDVSHLLGQLTGHTQPNQSTSQPVDLNVLLSQVAAPGGAPNPPADNSFPAASSQPDVTQIMAQLAKYQR